MAAPSWIPFLPPTGQLGSIAFNRERNREFVENFKRRVYQKHIPINAEHQTKLSGALGYIADMRLNDDGSADALMDWTERGRRLVEDGAFKYVSPEVYATWTDPATGRRFNNVIIGGALTNHPKFKSLTLEEHTMSTVTAEVLVKRATTDPKAYAEYLQR